MGQDFLDFSPFAFINPAEQQIFYVVGTPMEHPCVKTSSFCVGPVEYAAGRNCQQGLGVCLVCAFDHGVCQKAAMMITTVTYSFFPPQGRTGQCDSPLLSNYCEE